MEDPEPPSVVDGPSLLWQPEKRRSRKSGCSNIFAGVNLRQLRRLFHVAGDRDAEQRARLVWGREEIKEGLDHPEEDNEEEDPSDIGELDPLPGGSTGAEGGAQLTDAQKPSERPHLERLGAATRQEGTRDPERYLHRILH
uniref:Arginine vasopressin-induced protein 1 n=1 Tax=Oncorhynchus tshawytscha TaxID=74940 RepID=A0AAZ3RZB2_ONCTS